MSALGRAALPHVRAPRDADPLAAVTSVGSERTWLGKWVGRRLLRVRWTTAGGGVDAMAWEVRDLAGWIAALGGDR